MMGVLVGELLFSCCLLCDESAEDDVFDLAGIGDGINDCVSPGFIVDFKFDYAEVD